MIKEQKLAEFVNNNFESNADKLLSELQFSDTAKKIILDPNSLDKNNAGLKSIVSSNELLIQVRSSLNAIIHSLEENPSILSTLTQYWGSLSWGTRIIGGVLLSGPTLMVGVAANISFLVILSGLSAGAYITSGFVLQDHLEHTKLITEKLKQGVLEIADVLILTISALETIRHKLAIEVEQFQSENLKLTNNITTLSEQTYNLSIQIESYIITEKHLRQSKIELEKTAESLKSDLEKNSQKYDETIKQIKILKQDHERCTKLLSTNIEELTMKRKELEEELEKTKGIASTLQGTVETLASTVINNAQQREAFQARLENFVQNKEKSFAEFAERICQAESELTLIKTQLQEDLKHHNDLMVKQSNLVKHLEKLDKLIPENPISRDDKINIDVLCTYGLMSAPYLTKKELSVPPLVGCAFS